MIEMRRVLRLAFGAALLGVGSHVLWRIVRVGLSFEETEEFECLQKVLNRGRSSFEGDFERWEELGHRYKELHGRHQMARLERISAEYELNILKPARN